MQSQKGGVNQVVEAKLVYSEVPGIEIGEDKERLEDVGFLTSMVLVLLGNYSQTGNRNVLIAISLLPSISLHTHIALFTLAVNQT